MIVWKSAPYGALQITREGNAYRVTIAGKDSSIPLAPREVGDMAVALLADLESTPELRKLNREA